MAPGTIEIKKLGPAIFEIECCFILWFWWQINAILKIISCYALNSYSFFKHCELDGVLRNIE